MRTHYLLHLVHLFVLYFSMPLCLTYTFSLFTTVIIQENHQKALDAQQEQFVDEISKQVCRLGEEYDEKMFAASQELSEKVAAVVSEKEQLETRMKSAEDHLALKEQQHRQILTDLETQHERRMAEVETQHEAAVGKLKKLGERLTAELNRVQQETSAQLDQLKAKNAELVSELEMYRRSHDINASHKAELTRLEAEKSRIEQKLRSAEDQLQRLEAEKSLAIKSGEELREVLERKVVGLQTRLEEADERCREAVTRQQDSMQREHTLVVADLQEKLTKMQQRNHDDITSSGQVLPAYVTFISALFGPVLILDQ